MTFKQWAAWAFERLTGWRWHVTMSRASGQVYMDRWQLLKTRVLSVYVNHIRLPDEDPWLHTHPWRKSWSVKLRRRYVEEVTTVQDCTVAIREGSCRFHLPAYYKRSPGLISRIPKQHRIVEMPDEGVWTLFIGWRSELPWGFVRPETQETISWRERARMRGLPDSSFSGGQNGRA